MKTRILLSLIVASSLVLLAAPALAEPGPGREVNAGTLADQPGCRSATGFPTVPLFALTSAAVDSATVDSDALDSDSVDLDLVAPAEPGTDVPSPVKAGVNCSIWPPNCSCSCVESCYEQSWECVEDCEGDRICIRECREADQCCVDQCCGYSC